MKLRSRRRKSGFVRAENLTLVLCMFAWDYDLAWDWWEFGLGNCMNLMPHWIVDSV